MNVVYYVYPGLKSNASIKVVNGRKVIDSEYIISTICEYFRITEPELGVKSRKIEIVYRRQVTMYFLRKFTLESLVTIGQRMGGRDHTTVIHSLQSLQDALDTNERINAQVALIEKKILGN